jgi:hypothetical protein
MNKFLEPHKVMPRAELRFFVIAQSVLKKTRKLKMSYETQSSANTTYPKTI